MSLAMIQASVALVILMILSLGMAATSSAWPDSRVRGQPSTVEATSHDDILSSPHRGGALAAGTFPGNEFSMSIDLDGDTLPDCGTDSGPATCSVEAGASFALIVRLDSISLDDNDGDTTSGYTGFQVRVDNSSGLIQVDAAGSDEVLWPDASFPVEARTLASTVVGAASFNTESTFLGDMVGLVYTCESGGTLTMLHDAATGTNIVDDFGTAVSDDDDGESEELTVNCLATPTPTTNDLLGDVDCDGLVTAVDALLILQLGADLLSELPCMSNADKNDDGLINAIDAALLLQEVAGLTP